MSAETILYIVIAIVISFLVTVFMYGYKTKYKSTLRWVFGILRFVTLFSILLLLINPKFKSETYTVEKPNLVVLIDDTESVSEMDQVQNVLDLVQKITDSKELNDKFDVATYSFGDALEEGDSLSFSKSNTNISKALTGLSQLYKNEVAPTILISDGNQTLGKDYEFMSSTFKNQIYPVVLGDTTKYTDLKITQLNTNRYAFLKNQFPVELFLMYDGSEKVNSQLIISQGATIVFSENITFSKSENLKIRSLTLPATTVGLQKYEVQLLPLTYEKNVVNNRRRFAVEILDQATNVLLISDIIHPDLGTLIKAIESNEQRKVTLMKPLEAIPVIDDYQLIILYQPNRSFASLYQEVQNSKRNTFVIAGLQTDWNFLNSVQDNYNKDAINEYEYVTGVLNPNYGAFAIEPIEFDNFRPLKTQFGDLNITIPHEIILEQSIQDISSESAMLATMELDGRRNAIWDGEGFWKWRSEVYLESNTFEGFDDFIGNIVQYLASSKRRSRLEVNNETFYYNNNSIRITAQYFDQNFVFDSRGSLTISVINTETKKITEFPLLLKNNFYAVDLNSLAAGEYNYTVSVQDETISRSGNFSILDFNVEQQFLHANVAKLERAAANTGGKIYFSTESQNLINDLLLDDRYKQIQKSEQKVVPLVDWKFLLLIIVLTLASEWFIRKYNGLI